MYLFCRRVLMTSFWAAAIPAWCYPLTGFFVFWQGFPTCGAVYWFPWLLWLVNHVARGPSARNVAGLGGVTALVLVSGHIDVAGQTLLAAGLYAIWCLFDAHGARWRKVGGVALALTLGWGAGFLLAAPHVLPLLEYAKTGARIERRGAGTEERPPVGLSAIRLTVLPDIDGTTRTGSFWLGRGNQVESTAAAYSGLLATLFLAPLAWCSRRNRAFLACWLGLGLLGLTWCLNVPGFVSVLRLPVLNMMSHNRLVFVTSFAILVHAAVGLDLLRGSISWRRWFWVPITLALLLAVERLIHAWAPPEPVATQIRDAVQKGGSGGWIRTMADVARLQGWFFRSAVVSAVICGATAIAWFAVGRSSRVVRAGVVAAGILMVADLLWFAYGRCAQSDPALYFPRIPALEAIARSAPGRVVGYGCLPATLPQTHGLSDVRGYDSIDPAPMVNLLSLAKDPCATWFSGAIRRQACTRRSGVPTTG
jgi:hypothetical protein